MVFLAHVAQDQREQTLAVHLSEVAFLTALFAQKIGLKNAGMVLGLLHDFGKYSLPFQQYLKSATGLLNPDLDEDYVDAKAQKGKIDHSTAGAQLVWQRLSAIGAKLGQGELCGQILALCIASHHGGLIDCFDRDDINTFCKRMDKQDENTHLEECKAAADASIYTQAQNLLTDALVREMMGRIQQMVSFSQNRLEIVDSFNLGFLTRFLFSCLIDADRLSSAEFEDPERQKARLAQAGPVKWHIALDRLETYLATLSPRNYVDELRKEISDNCQAKATQAQGIYTLTVPTGGGKTLASLRYALHHAQHHGLERIIYIIPYTSIIEQNAQAVRTIIERSGDARPWVLEHHSNLEPERQTWESKLATDNWDAPIVFTTMVQLLETFFGGGTRSVRRLHQLANSILIFDEIQTLPIKCTHLFCNALNFLVDHAKTTAVLCTATQPLLNQLPTSANGQLNIPKDNELAGDVARYFEQLKRVLLINEHKTPGWQAPDIAQLALLQFQQTGNCLVIVNTKRWAKDLYQRSQEQVPEEALFHLSTSLCAAHRKQLLARMLQRLEDKQPVLCISTQLIEAGVDIDFASVIRFTAGLDSIAQAAGRCNRHGKLENRYGELEKGKVWIIHPAEENLNYLPDIKKGKEVAERVLREIHDNYLAPIAIGGYFKYYFFQREKEMVYPLSRKQLGRDNTLLSLLSQNEKCTRAFAGRERGQETKLALLTQPFKEAGKQFKAIDAPTQAVIVPYGAGKALIAQLCATDKQFDAKTYYSLLRQAQQYSVNVFPHIWRALQAQRAVCEVQEGYGIYYLQAQYYSEAFGLDVEEVGSLMDGVV